ncbi:pyridoxamine 5'-phosphate oxidase family protein [Kitasatospora sp. NA04385]|uniref:pyridoxamine 5'-phosphate oxidase family protein n=1 Tax=Kitasatospora sp. NA04385 TaxID=2742135 RepID=UPI0015927CEE|nr:pyridoxamine 5'-phosphate oxidase family protein [Kitasatospora sp. NA04385]QKW20520.1 pyridoxamine 5'-phosphate oxidase family protein [Kitasatospora sp. NA04385]
MSRYDRLARTPSVRRVQQEMGSAAAAERRLRTSDDAPDDRPDDGPEPLSAAAAAFVQGLDGFLFATVNEDGWPYIQHRGGPPGFVHVLDPYTLGYLDVRGNRQYLTTGNLRGGDGRVALFFLDHARQARLKVFGRATAVPADRDPDLARRLATPRTDGRVEQLVTISVEAHAWNCPNHITPRFTERELADVLDPIRDRLARLERENALLRAELAAATGAHPSSRPKD